MQIKDASTPQGRHEADPSRIRFSELDSPWPINEGTGTTRWTHGFLFERPNLPKRQPRQAGPLQRDYRGDCPIDARPIYSAHPTLAKYCSATCRKRAQMARRRAAA